MLVNRALAVGFRDGFGAGLAALDEVAGQPRRAGANTEINTPPDLQPPAGRPAEAADAYRAALPGAATDQVRAFLQRRLVEVTT